MNNSWESHTLADVVEVASGQVDPTEPPYSDMPHVGGDNIESDTGKLVHVSTAKELGLTSGKYLFGEEDVLYSKIRPALNKVVAPDFKGICSADIYPIRPRSGKLCREYLVYLLRSQDFLGYAAKHSSRTNIPKINREALLAYSALIPPLDEQRRIAAILDKADAIRRKRGEGIRLTEELLRSTFLEMFGDPAMNPKAWPVRPFGELVKNEDGRRKPVKQADRADRQGEYPYYGASGIIDYVDEFIFDERTLLVAEDGANLLTRSLPIAFIAEGKYWVNNHAHVVSENGQANLDYLRFSLNLRRIDDFVTGSAQPKLNQASLNRLLVPTPPLSLQKRFATLVQKIEAILTQRQTGKHEAEVLFGSLVQRAFRGEL